MTGLVTIELYGQPRGKGRPRSRISARGGSFAVAVYTDPKTRSYEAMLRDAAQQAMGDRPLFDGPLSVFVAALFLVPQSWPAKKRNAALDGFVRPTGRPDCDNIIKTLDSMNGVVWRDDAQIVECKVVKEYADRPLLRILVEGAI